VVTVCAAVAVATLAACNDEQEGPAPHTPPSVLHAAVAPGPHNVLSAVVSVSFADADSARVRFGTEESGLDSLTPMMLLPTDSVDIPVLGLLPAAAYRLQVIAYGEGGSATSDTLSLTTGALPLDLPTYSAGGTDPTPGYVVFAAYPYGVVIDNIGRVVWYRHLDGGATLNFQVQPTGRYTTSPITPAPGDLTPWVEYDPLGNETRRLGCVNGLVARFHEMVAEPDGTAWLLCDDSRVMDLTAYGGQQTATVTGTAVQHVSATGTLLFSWTPFDHFEITDLDPASRTGATVNWTHGNSIDFDAVGNLLLSFRSLNELTKIDKTTGEVLWRFGGLRNQFALSGVAAGFVGQHGLRIIGPGQLQLLDNRGDFGDSHAERYVMDEVAYTAQLTSSYFSGPPVNAILGGSTQQLPLGRLLVAYGNGNRVQEYDAAGNVVWEIAGNPGYVFRAQRIVSLYQPGVGTAR
jgi:hypothetical protein